MPLTDGMIDYSLLSQFIENIDTKNPATGITIKQLYDNRFELMYITVEKMLTHNEYYKAAQKIAYKFLDELEKELKRAYKEKTGERLKFKVINEREGHEPIGYFAGGPGRYNESFYFRLIRQYQIDIE